MRFSQCLPILVPGFHDLVGLVGRQMLLDTESTRWPADGHLPNLRDGAQPDEQPRVVRRLHAASPLALPRDGPAPCDDFDARADRVPVAPRTDELEANPFVTIAR